MGLLRVSDSHRQLFAERVEAPGPERVVEHIVEVPLPNPIPESETIMTIVDTTESRITLLIAGLCENAQSRSHKSILAVLQWSEDMQAFFLV